MKKNNVQIITGAILLIISLFVFFTNIKFFTWGLYKITAPMVAFIALIIAAIISAVVKSCKATKIFAVLSPLPLIVYSISRLKISFYGISIFEWIIIILTAGLGLGLIIKEIIKK